MFLFQRQVKIITTMPSLRVPQCLTQSVLVKRNASYKVVDEKDFCEKIEKSTNPIIVDFCANWCKPCKTLEPRLDNVVAKHKGKISVAQVDIDNMAEVAAKYEVGSIPALVVFRNGKVEERLVGLQDEAKLCTWVEQVVGKKCKK